MAQLTSACTVSSRVKSFLPSIDHAHIEPFSVAPSTIPVVGSKPAQVKTTSFDPACELARVLPDSRL